MDILECDYPNNKHIFAYDNASTHLKHPGNALSASKMTIKPSTNFLFDIICDDGSAVHRVQMENGVFADGMLQELYFPEGHAQAGQFKGMRVLIQEQHEHGANLPNPAGICGLCKKCTVGETWCCLQCILYSEPDFSANGKSVLEQLCTAHRVSVVWSSPVFGHFIRTKDQTTGPVQSLT
jgi:hypothetical protein